MTTTTQTTSKSQSSTNGAIHSKALGLLRDAAGTAQRFAQRVEPQQVEQVRTKAERLVRSAGDTAQRQVKRLLP